MTNAEIDIRNKSLADAIADRAHEMYASVNKINMTALEGCAIGTRIELELLNMSLIGITSMLGEIAKRLPEAPHA